MNLFIFLILFFIKVVLPLALFLQWTSWKLLLITTSISANRLIFPKCMDVEQFPGAKKWLWFESHVGKFWYLEGCTKKKAFHYIFVCWKNAKKSLIFFDDFVILIDSFLVFFTGRLWYEPSSINTEHFARGRSIVDYYRLQKPYFCMLYRSYHCGFHSLVFFSNWQSRTIDISKSNVVLAGFEFIRNLAIMRLEYKLQSTNKIEVRILEMKIRIF